MKHDLSENRLFYKRVLTLAVPIVIQNSITQMVSLLDNLMVGQLGTLPMSGVSIVNQLLLVFNLIIFGASSGTGIFTAQFYGSGDDEGIRHTFRFKVILAVLTSVVCITAFSVCGDALICLFLQGDGAAEDAEQMLAYGQEYLKLMLLGLLPFSISGSYASTLRECGETKVPMVASVTAVFSNLILNYILIFGHLGLPALGIAGAAIATVISRFVELAIVGGWTHLHAKRFPFIKGAYRSLYIPGHLLRMLFGRVTPLVLNETLWSVSVTFINQSYSTCGLHVVNAVNILGTIDNLSNVAGISMGNTVGILMGQMMGAAEPKERILQKNQKLLRLNLMVSLALSVVLIAISGGFPKLYNTTQEIRSLAAKLILCMALAKPFRYYCLSVYYSIRSGGSTWVTFLYDCGFLAGVAVPLAFVLSRFTDISIIPMYLLCQVPEVFKSAVGAVLVKKGNWIHNLTQK